MPRDVEKAARQRRSFNRAALSRAECRGRDGAVGRRRRSLTRLQSSPLFRRREPSTPLRSSVRLTSRRRVICGHARLHVSDGRDGDVQTEKGLQMPCQRLLRNAQFHKLIDHVRSQIWPISALSWKFVEASLARPADVSIEAVSNNPAPNGSC